MASTLGRLGLPGLGVPHRTALLHRVATDEEGRHDGQSQAVRQDAQDGQEPHDGACRNQTKRQQEAGDRDVHDGGGDQVGLQDPDGVGEDAQEKKGHDDSRRARVVRHKADPADTEDHHDGANDLARGGGAGVLSLGHASPQGKETAYGRCEIRGRIEPTQDRDTTLP